MTAKLCPLCSSPENKFFIMGFDHDVAREKDFAYHQCLKCGMIYMYPMPGLAEIATFYQGDYDPHQENNLEDLRLKRRINRFLIKYHYGTKAGVENPILRLAAKIASGFAMKDTLLPHGQCRLLDVGCGHGGFIYRHQAMGWNVEGVEFVRAACDSGRRKGLKITEGTLDDLRSSGPYDIITLRHVVEHLPNPVEVLTKARQLLADGGKIILKCPNIASHGFKKYRSCWMPLEAPRHLLQFTPQTMEKLADRTDMRISRLYTENFPHLLVESRHIRDTLGEKYLQVGDISMRQELIAESKRKKCKNKLYRKMIFVPTTIRSWSGQGETMHVEMSKK